MFFFFFFKNQQRSTCNQINSEPKVIFDWLPTVYFQSSKYTFERIYIYTLVNLKSYSFKIRACGFLKVYTRVFLSLNAIVYNMALGEHTALHQKSANAHRLKKGSVRMQVVKERRRRKRRTSIAIFFPPHFYT